MPDFTKTDTWFGSSFAILFLLDEVNSNRYSKIMNNAMTVEPTETLAPNLYSAAARAAGPNAEEMARLNAIVLVIPAKKGRR